MNTCVLSERAKDELLEIYLHTLDTWGEDQLSIYQSMMETAIQRIAKNPFTPGSKALDKIIDGCRSFRCGKHCLIYRVQSGQVAIARILQESMDFFRHIDEELHD